ncbi:MAG: DUF4149 domain-containing protein [Candidatus Omnitrophica bacterium]|nr:DUF4149 domain-containing protein [Candidatus Omnitrophota bacterium]
MLAVIPAAFRSLPREEAGRLVGLLFPPVQRWVSVWAAAACGMLFLLFYRRHLEARSLVLEIPLAIAALLTFYSAGIVQPEIQDIRRRMQQPEFQGTAHLEKLRVSFQHRHQLSVRLHGAILFLGWFTLCLAARFLN